MLGDVLGMPAVSRPKTTGQYLLGFDLTWDELNTTEVAELGFSQARSIDECLERHPWLATAQSIASEQGFFHWDLDFAAVMATGGFELQLGNPPWVRPDINFDELLAESDPWWKIAHKPTQAQKSERLSRTLTIPSAGAGVVTGVVESSATAAALGSIPDFPYLRNQRPDLYRGFMERTWSNASASGVISLIHPESHFTEKKAATLRRGAYLRLRRHWQFINEYMLFDVDHHVNYGIHVYAGSRTTPSFQSASSLYHPRTVVESLQHSGEGPLPGLKDDDGSWDLRPHRDRIIDVDEHELGVWKSILEDPDTPLLDTRMVYTVNTEAAAVLEKLARAPRMRSLGLQFSGGWNETTDKEKGYFDTGWQHPETWDDVILQGPHLGVSTPMIKQPNPTMKHNQDWSEVDLEAMPEDFIPATAYFPDRAAKPDYDTAYGTWETTNGPVPATSRFRIAWRRMAASTGFRTLYPCIIPPRCAHVDAVISASPEVDGIDLALMGAVCSTLIADFFVRSSSVSDIRGSFLETLPFCANPGFRDRLSRLFLRLNCATSIYSPLWEEVTGEPWTRETPIRTALERQLAQIEIDVMVALSLGVTAEELCMIYRTQFPVMRKYDLDNRFDANGRLIPKQIAKADTVGGVSGILDPETRKWVHPQSGVEYTFEYPFTPVNREAEFIRTSRRLQS